MRSPIRYYLSAYGKVRGQQGSQAASQSVGHVITAAAAAAAAAGGGPRPGGDDLSKDWKPLEARWMLLLFTLLSRHTVRRWRPPARRR